MKQHQQDAREAIAKIIDQSWYAIEEILADHSDELAVAEMGQTYPSCWVLVMGCSSIENPDAEHMALRLTPRGQLPFTSMGLLEDVLANWRNAP